MWEWYLPQKEKENSQHSRERKRVNDRKNLQPNRREVAKNRSVIGLRWTNTCNATTEEKPQSDFANDDKKDHTAGNEQLLHKDLSVCLKQVVLSTFDWGHSVLCVCTFCECVLREHVVDLLLKNCRETHGDRERNDLSANTQLDALATGESL